MPYDGKDVALARLGLGAAVAEAEMEEEEDHLMSAMDNGVAVTLCVGGYFTTLGAAEAVLIFWMDFEFWSFLLFLVDRVQREEQQVF